jgi:hypothetical protein
MVNPIADRSFQARQTKDDATVSTTKSENERGYAKEEADEWRSD